MWYEVLGCHLPHRTTGGAPPFWEPHLRAAQWRQGEFGQTASPSLCPGRLHLWQCRYTCRHLQARWREADRKNVSIYLYMMSLWCLILNVSFLKDKYCSAYLCAVYYELSRGQDGGLPNAFSEGVTVLLPVQTGLRYTLCHAHQLHLTVFHHCYLPLSTTYGRWDCKVTLSCSVK